MRCARPNIPTLDKAPFALITVSRRAAAPAHQNAESREQLMWLHAGLNQEASHSRQLPMQSLTFYVSISKSNLILIGMAA
jgi:hypothetical protein